jgi:hypothetical protein
MRLQKLTSDTLMSISKRNITVFPCIVNQAKTWAAVHQETMSKVLLSPAVSNKAENCA